MLTFIPSPTKKKRCGEKGKRKAVKPPGSKEGNDQRASGQQSTSKRRRFGGYIGCLKAWKLETLAASVLPRSSCQRVLCLPPTCSARDTQTASTGSRYRPATCGVGSRQSSLLLLTGKAGVGRRLRLVPHPAAGTPPALPACLLNGLIKT
ncbi:hypothetical protein CK203_062841 [Vitis vinifera]|uniref:Uncharacterized protein n=1 Tax=Vitis vinifera TaxID=29760 RepID=A0A438G888_VITVI|nr:hypothetical protein CK203_062841 [Vitis vinifera]